MKIEISKLTNQDKVERKMPKVKFNSFSNMKIAINDQQSLDEVVRELERIGANKCGFIMSEGFILSDGDLYTWCSSKSVDTLYDDHELTTLTQLKEMK